MLSTVVQYLLTGIFMAYFGNMAWKNKDTCINIFRNINIKLFAFVIPVLALTGTVAYLLITLSPRLMGWSVLSLIGANGGNLNTAGATLPYLGIIFCLLLLAVLPWFAQIEEELFRAGTKNWSNALKRSIYFGFAHMIMGVPLGGAIALILPGLYFTYEYFKGGVERSTQAHFQYNFVAVMILLTGSVIITVT